MCSFLFSFLSHSFPLPVVLYACDYSCTVPIQGIQIFHTHMVFRMTENHASEVHDTCTVHVYFLKYYGCMYIHVCFLFHSSCSLVARALFLGVNVFCGN